MFLLTVPFKVYDMEPEGGGDSTLTKLSKGTAPFRIVSNLFIFSFGVMIFVVLWMLKEQQNVLLEVKNYFKKTIIY